jgi:hypothetical protein
MHAILALVATSAALTAPTALAGTTTFYSNADYTGKTTTISTPACTGNVRQLIGHFAAVDNRPVAGCKVELYANASPHWVTLCVGRSVLPAFLQNNAEVRVVEGSALPCVIVAG